jgi:spermidine synthase
MALLAITNHLCQDIAVVPFMWVIPLSLYLITFIICFDSERWYVRKIFGTAAVLGTLWLTAMHHYCTVDEWVIKLQKPITAIQQRFAERSARAKLKAEGKEVQDAPAAADVDPIDFSDSMDKLLDGIDWTVRTAGSLMGRITGKKYDWRFNVDTYDFFDSVVAASTAYLLILFLICMACHGELVKSKPAPEHLTSFFLFISAGGAVGGLFVALICPLIFKSHFELSLVMMGGFVVGCVALFNDGRETWLKNREVLQWIAAFILIGGLLLVAKGNIENPEKNVIAEVRNFYGTVRVEEKGEDEYRGRYLYNGRIWHGFQYLDPARQIEATTYYVNGTGAALAVQQHPRASGGLRIAVIGLGTGSMAAHCKAGDMIRFYDIDPKVVDVARKYFTYLDKNHAGKQNTEVVLGDARISMERELKEKGSQEFDVIVLDAFSSDAIPAHLLTVESFDLYDKHLRKENGKTTGIMAIHISNRYLDLEPVVLAIAEKFGYQTWNVHKDEEDGPIDTGSDWVLASKNEAFMNNPAVKEAGVALDPNKKLLWTDPFTALYPILK